MTWECLVEGKNFITDLGEEDLSDTLGDNRFAVWIPDPINKGKHCLVEIGCNINLLKEKYHVASECVFSIARKED